jgi:hypothetical protein
VGKKDENPDMLAKNTFTDFTVEQARFILNSIDEHNVNEMCTRKGIFHLDLSPTVSPAKDSNTIIGLSN